MKIIFFDGYCGLCNGFVDFIMKVDKNNVFKFSPLQSDFAKTKLTPNDYEDLSSVVVLINGKAYRKSKGVIKALAALGHGWGVVSLFSILPYPLLNWGYDFVAENRYKLFGKRDTCRLPSPEEREKFIL